MHHLLLWVADAGLVDLGGAEEGEGLQRHQQGRHMGAGGVGSGAAEARAVVGNYT